MLTKKLRFFTRSPSKLVYIGAFKKILGSVGQKWIFLKVPKGGPFGSAGGRIPGGERPPPSKSAPEGNSRKLVGESYQFGPVSVKLSTRFYLIAEWFSWYRKSYILFYIVKINSRKRGKK